MALRARIDQEILRKDLNVDACVDLIAGLFYCQLVARGERIDDLAARTGCRTALEIVWRGMAPTSEDDP